MSRSGQCVSEYRYCCIWSCLSLVQSKIFGKGLSTFCSRFLNNEILTISATQRFLCSINRNLTNNMLMLTIKLWTMRSCINVLVMPKPLCVCVCVCVCVSFYREGFFRLQDVLRHTWVALINNLVFWLLIFGTRKDDTIDTGYKSALTQNRRVAKRY